MNLQIMNIVGVGDAPVHKVPIWLDAKSAEKNQKAIEIETKGNLVKAMHSKETQYVYELHGKYYRLVLRGE